MNPSFPVSNLRCKALEAFKSVCSPLFGRHAEDIVGIKVAVEDGWSPRARMGMWRRDRVRWFSGIGRKHSLIRGPAAIISCYILGGGPKPGFLVMKRVSQAACALPVHDDQPDAFVTMPAFFTLAALLPRR